MSQKTGRSNTTTARIMLSIAGLWLVMHAGTSLAEAITRAPYLLLGTPTSMQIRWKTDTASVGRVYYGANPWKLTTFVDEPASGTEHSVTLSGLTPDTRYWYSVGNNTPATLASGLNYKFVTSPPAAVGKPTRIWVVGDAGTGNANQDAVRDAYVSYNGARETDVWLLLGDNAYNDGSEPEYDAKHFAKYANVMRNSVSWYTLGNHETGTGAAGAHPYFSLFSFPTAGQAGGVSSGTKAYFSFDYGNVHFISLDSMQSSRAVGGPMHSWLQLDLLANTKPWLIAYWHHPAYSKASHNSDTEIELIEMRTNMLPLLEQFGVDLVLAGHSHAYERSMLIDSHYGLSTTLTNAMKLNSGDGRPAGDGAYMKGAVGLAPHQGTVYATVGSSGRIDGFPAAFHPAMKVSLNNLASLVVDIDGNRLDGTMIRENGSKPDTFTIIKGGLSGNVPPTVAIATPATNTAVANGSTVPLTATAGDVNGGTVTQVAYFANGVQVGSANAAPFASNWSAPVGLHRITARATDNNGAMHMSAPVFVSVTSPFDVDGNGQVDALTDGLLAVRYMFGVRGPQLTAAATGPGSYRDATAMSPYFTASPDFDIDGNGKVDAATDGLLLVRYLFGMRGPQLTSGAIGADATRSPVQIEVYLGNRVP
jgi:hypothetical protein